MKNVKAPLFLVAAILATAWMPHGMFAQSTPASEVVQRVNPDERKDATKPPALTEVEKLQVINAAKDVELWQLKAQQAASEFEKARDILQKLVAAVTPSGYQLDDKLNLVKVPESKEPPKAKD